MENIKIGDVVAYRSNSIVSEAIRAITSSKYSHVAIVVSPTQLVEADGYVGHIRYRNISDYKGGMDIYTCNFLTESQRKEICDYAISRIGQKYDYLLLFFLFLKQIFKFKFRFIDSKADICSELVNDSYSKANCRLVKKRYPNPQDIVSSDKLIFVESC